MKTLEETLKSLQAALANPTPAKAQALVHRPAVTTTAIQPPAPAMKVRPLSPAEKLSETQLLDGTDTPLMNDPAGQDELTRLLYQTFASQKTFGDKAQMMEYRDSMFQLVLGNYPIRLITEAFIEFVKRKADLPSPSDIVNLIDPLPEPLSAAMYISLQKRVHQGEYLMRDEREFCEAFRAQELAKARGGSDTLTEANREVESWKSLQITHED